MIKFRNEFSYELFDDEGNCRDDTLTYYAQTLAVFCL